MHGLFLWKRKNNITITDVFQKLLDESRRTQIKQGILLNFTTDS